MYLSSKVSSSMIITERSATRARIVRLQQLVLTRYAITLEVKTTYSFTIFVKFFLGLREIAQDTIFILLHITPSLF